MIIMTGETKKKMGVRFAASKLKMFYKNKPASALERETVYLGTKKSMNFTGRPLKKSVTRKRGPSHPVDQVYVNMHWYWDGKNVRRSRACGGFMSQADAIRVAELMASMADMFEEYKKISSKYNVPGTWR